MSEPNERFPLQADYTGPDTGMFLFCYHDRLCGYVWSVRERVDWVRQQKEQHEQAIRAAHFCLLTPEDVPEIPAPVWTESVHLQSESKRLWSEGYRLQSEGNSLRAEANRCWAEGDRVWAEGYRLLQPYDPIIESVARRLIPDYRWNGKEIDFT